MADYGVRKYDSFTGRFMTADVLFEKYPAWNPYHYSVNNPITMYDDNGYWAKEISDINHVHSGKISRNSNGYLAQQINFEFYDNWTEKAPAVANFVANNDLFTMQSTLEPNVYGKGVLGGNLSMFDLGKKDSHKLLEGNALHEIVHNMGYKEFGAWSAMIAAGYISKKDMKFKLENGDYFYYLYGNDELIKTYRDKKVSTDEVIEKMLEQGSKIIGTSK